MCPNLNAGNHARKYLGCDAWEDGFGPTDAVFKYPVVPRLLIEIPTSDTSSAVISLDLLHLLPFLLPSKNILSSSEAMEFHNGTKASDLSSPPPECPASGSQTASNSINGANGTTGFKTAGPVSKNAARVNPPVAKPTRKEVDATFAKFASLINASNRPLPHRFGDGRDESASEPETMTGYIQDIAALRQGGYIIESIQTLWMALGGKGKPADDKTMIVCSLCRAHSIISVANGLDGTTDPIDLAASSYE